MAYLPGSNGGIVKLKLAIALVAALAPAGGSRELATQSGDLAYPPRDDIFGSGRLDLGRALELLGP